MSDVIGYEKGIPHITAKIKTGYPRFVIHPFLKKIEAYWQNLFAQPECSIWVTSSAKIARELEAHLADPRTKFLGHGGVSGLRLPGSDTELNRRAKKFLQHVGGFLSSRNAEDYLFAQNKIDSIEPEELHLNDPDTKIKSTISPWLGNAPDDSIILTSNGMNAFYATYQAINAIQAPKGKRSWIKLGWLYVDTMNIVDKLAPPDSENIYHYDVFDLDGLEQLIGSRANDFAGIITECPTNPLVHTIDLKRIREIATKHQIYLVVDPTMNSIANVDVAPFADVIVNSLTKYAGNQGDIIMGSITATSQCPEASKFLELAKSNAEPLYPRDSQRLAAQIEHYEALVTKANANTQKVVTFLEQQKPVSKIHWSLEERSRDNYNAIARNQDSAGCMLSFEIDGLLETFFDALPLAKGPSFGLKQSIACPFIYLAHYDLISTEQGRAYLDKAGINPDLIRLSIGEEEPEQIIAALQTGFDALSV